ncbi:DNA-binding protein [Ramlibacter albus]|uniref:DNA-binding protein n=1 Tax=Ramlibacter albus TaxID=2079448 RepID=A0A923MBB1_9BURK|nr:DNA-binding protein [Ramlibacter albus]MBC5766224.1 DNA-binding protein [Ramlibacter albus]
MSLENLVKIKQLQHHTTSPQEVARLLGAASGSLTDAMNERLSDASRFDLAYKCIMQCAMVALLANGYRPSTTMPGHHQTMIQSLPLTLGVEKEMWVVLDTLRKKRNQSDYSGELIEPAAVRACVDHAQALQTRIKDWLQRHRPDLAPK